MSAFKILYQSVLKQGKVPEKLKKPIKCYVKESSPYFLVTDDFFYVPCYFTKKAVDSFKSKHSGVNITDLKSKVVEIGDWSLEMASVDSSSVFTSFRSTFIVFNSLDISRRYWISTASKSRRVRRCFLQISIWCFILRI